MATLKNDFLEMLERLRNEPGGDIFATLDEELANGLPSVAIRLNPRKTAGLSQALRPIGWTSNGYYIDGERPRFTFDPALHQGLYYVQDPSSMVVGEIVRRLSKEKDKIVAIDSCAAPGGKTTAAIDALPAGSLMIANEYDYARAEILRENIMKWGYPNVVVSRGETSKIGRLTEIADIILADVPCSGEGMMRKDSDAVDQWSERLVKSCAGLQREIVENVWPALKRGGFLIYSTCTFNTDENELNVIRLAEALDAEIIEVPVDLQHGIAPGIGENGRLFRRFIPGRVEGEGLFVALLQKKGSQSEPSNTKKTKRTQKSSTLNYNHLNQWVTGDFKFFVKDDTVFALPTVWAELIGRIDKTLDIIYQGVEMAQIKGKDLIPSQSLAMSEVLHREAFQTADIDYSTAISYLSRQAVTLPENTPRGLILLVYDNQPLGFVKNLGNRSNNLYPKQFAIRSNYQPGQSVSILSKKAN